MVQKKRHRKKHSFEYDHILAYTRARPQVRCVEQKTRQEAAETELREEGKNNRMLAVITLEREGTHKRSEQGECG